METICAEHIGPGVRFNKHPRFDNGRLLCTYCGKSGLCITGVIAASNNIMVTETKDEGSMHTITFNKIGNGNCVIMEFWCSECKARQSMLLTNDPHGLVAGWWPTILNGGQQ